MTETPPKVRASRKGVPLKPDAVRKRHAIGFRVNDETRDGLLRDATAGQRSLSEEVEFQLQRSRDAGRVLNSIFYDQQAMAMFRDMAEIVERVRRVGAKRNYTEVELREALGAVFDCVRDVYLFVPDHRSPATPTSDEPLEATDSSEESLTEGPPAKIGYALAQHYLSNTERWEMAISEHVDRYWVR